MLDSFRSRLVISNLLITLVGLLVVVAVFINVLANRSQDVKRNGLVAESRLVANQLEFYFQHAVNAPLQDVVDGASRTLHVRVIVVRASDQNIIVDSATHTQFFKGSWTLDRQALRKAQTATGVERNGNLMAFQTPLQGTRGHLIGAVVLVANVSDVRPGLFALRDLFLLVLGTALLVWLAIGLFFTFSISRPLLRVIHATQRMARGKYDARVPAGGNGEISRLATSFNAMAQQIQGSNRVLKDFVANVSHDLRTPLTMITGFSQAMLDGTAQPEEIEEAAAVIHDEAVKMQHMVDDLLQLTRLESGLFSFRRQAVETVSLVQGVVDRIQRAHAGQPGAQVVTNLPAGTPPVEVDREHFERALRNLLENALQYTPPQGVVRVATRSGQRGWVEIEVSDTGAGISADDLPRIFERFYRTDKSRERGHGHSGLGLAIVREIVEGHGGRIEVESVVNRGTTFRLTVPRARVSDAEHEPVSGQEPVSGRVTVA